MPTPVIDNVLPLVVAGPDNTLNVTGLPEAPPVALNVSEPTASVTGDVGAMKLIVCAAWLTVSGTVAVSVL